MSINLRLRVRNVLGIKKADVDLNKGIILVGGLNGAGKSSLLEAAACAALQDPHVRGLGTLKAAAAALHEGAEVGSATLEYGDGTMRVVYPDAKKEQTGKPIEIGTALGIGARRFMALKPDDRAREITERFKTRPTKDDLAEWFAKHAEAKLKPAAIDTLWTRIEEQGWDVTHAKAKEHGTKLKGQWEQVTGRQWGAKLAKNWTPTNLLEGEQYDLVAEAEAEEEAKRQVEELLARNAVGAAERHRLAQAVTDGEAAAAELRKLVDEAAQLSEQAEALIAEHGKHAEIAGQATSLSCPHCGKPVRYVTDLTDGRLEKAPKPPPMAAVHEAKAALDRIAGDRSAVAQKLSGNAQAQARARGAVEAGTRAAAELERLKEQPAVDEEQIKAARERALEQQRKVTAIKAMVRAREIVADFERHSFIIASVDPDGVRKAVLQRRLSEINAKLGEISSMAKFSEVALDDGLSATYGGRAYSLLSESERWRVDLVLTMALGEQEGAELLLVDRLDVLHPGARPAVLLTIHARGTPALIACTAKEKAALPDLEKARKGTVRWLEEGVLA